MANENTNGNIEDLNELKKNIEHLYACQECGKICREVVKIPFEIFRLKDCDGHFIYRKRNICLECLFAIVNYESMDFKCKLGDEAWATLLNIYRFFFETKHEEKIA